MSLALAKNPGPQGKLGIPDFSPITEIDGVNFGSHKMMICVYEWNTEPRLCVIFGAEDVATYQFRYRSSFTIETRNFLADVVTEEQHIAVVLGISFFFLDMVYKFH